MLPSFAYSRPRTLDQAIEQLKTTPGRVHAGGTDLLGCLREGILQAPHVVSISAIDALRGIEPTDDGGLRLGALVTVAELGDDETIRDRFPGLSSAALQVASPQLRNQGTLGGNLCQKPRCWYYRSDLPCLRNQGVICSAESGDNSRHAIFGGSGCHMVHPSDLAPMLVALGAVARLRGPAGTRAVPLEAFYLLPEGDLGRETVLETDEVLTEIYLPAVSTGDHSSYRKVRNRQTWDFALVGVALALNLDQGMVRRARVVFSGVAPTPWRSRATEQALVGHKLEPAVIQRAAKAACAAAEPLEGNGYKVPLLRGLVTEQLSAFV